MQHNNIANTHRSLCALEIVFTIITIRPVYIVNLYCLHDSLEKIINIKKIIIIIKMGGVR